MNGRHQVTNPGRFQQATQDSATFPGGPRLRAPRTPASWRPTGWRFRLTPTAGDSQPPDAASRSSHPRPGVRRARGGAPGLPPGLPPALPPQRTRPGRARQPIGSADRRARQNRPSQWGNPSPRGPASPALPATSTRAPAGARQPSRQRPHVPTSFTLNGRERSVP